MKTSTDLKALLMLLWISICFSFHKLSIPHKNVLLIAHESASATNSANNPIPISSPELLAKEGEIVSKGLTHIKYNKFAPSPEEAASMTGEQFREHIYRRMREEERQRRSAGPVGNAVSDDYLNSLSRKPSSEKNE
jgi:hypothetical protein